MENRTLPFNKYQQTNKRLCCNTNGGKQYFFANEPNGNKNDDIFSDSLKVAEEIKKKIIYEQFDAILFLYSKILKENKRKKSASKEIDEKVEEAINTTLEIYSLIESNDEQTKKIYLKKIFSICDIIYNLLVEYTKNYNSKQLKEKITNHESEKKEKPLKDSCKDESDHIISKDLKQIPEENKAQNRTETTKGNKNLKNRKDDSINNIKEDDKASGIKEIKRIVPSFRNNIKKKEKKEYLYKEFSQTNNLLCLYGASELNEKKIYDPYKKMKRFKFYKNIDKNLRVNKRDELIERFEKIMKSSEKIKVYQSEKKIKKTTDLKKLLLKSRKSITKFELDKNGNIKTVTELFQKYEEKKKNIITLDGYNDNFIKIKELSNLKDELKKGKKILSEKKNPVLYSEQCGTSNMQQNKTKCSIFNTNLFIDVNKEFKIIESTTQDSSGNGNYIFPEKKIKSKTNSMIQCHNNYKHIDKKNRSNKRKNWDKYIAHINFYMQNMNGIRFVNYYDDDEIIKHILKENEQKKNKTKLDILDNKILQHNHVSLHKYGGGLYEYTNKIKLNNSKKRNMDIYSELFMNKYEILSKIYNLNQNKKDEIVKLNEKKNPKEINALKNDENKQMNNIKKLRKNYDKNKLYQKNCEYGKNTISSIFLSNCFEKKREISKKDKKSKAMSVPKKTTKKKAAPILEKKKYQLSQQFKLESEIKYENDKVSDPNQLESKIKFQNDNTVEIKEKEEKINCENDKVSDPNQLESKIKFQNDNTVEIKEKEEKINCEQMHLMDKENRTYSIVKIASIISKISKLKRSIYNKKESNENKTNTKIEGFIFNENLKDITIKSYNINNKSSKDCIKYISDRVNDNKIKDGDTEEKQIDLILSKKGIYQTNKEGEKNDQVIKKNTNSLSSSLCNDVNKNDSMDLNDFMKKKNSNKEDNIDDYLGGMETISRNIQIENDKNDKEETINNYLKTGFFANVHIMLSDTNIITRKCKLFYDNKTKKLGIMRNKKLFKIDVSKLMIQEIPSLEPDLAIIKIIVPQNNCKLLIVESSDFFGLQALGDKIGWSPDINGDSALEITRVISTKYREDNTKGIDYKLNSFNNKI
ncbi:conserved Plasmodium protein, unknown function [Plasmodium berghei]|uniref:Uncharacterized protein n=2 Tax=Plasmodium berghei TaxID=5821 RepID=A0A509AL69_PLABA|nr:conserved Plasmodium protein, unknown function [Plasmodium berghei ANKA]SCM16165.1 conserved Plasmodium protein, unknown function [Plasmodium berghei]SCN26341.1 conserved Plasmodium protein, unknown function [Plasmodium berghei]VUC56287.1 conserved Plasmodium protein, unknown function [Plasmodium berghei ANKA]|eukprot:XP_034422089.1 conserved Plasmodium protein, unknown function [Plasmodium berghei ANKA]